MIENLHGRNYELAKAEADEVDEQIIEVLQEGHSFRVEAGAGSGKTYSLNKVIEWIQSNKWAEYSRKKQNVICITYTDAVTFVKAEQDYENGKLVYEVEFVTNDGGKVVEYDYEIDAATGSVVSYDYDAENYVSATGATTVSVDEATAKQTVLNKVPGATAANIYEWKLDFDDGRWEYDGKIVYNLMEYDFTGDASSGAVTEWGVESIFD